MNDDSKSIRILTWDGHQLLREGIAGLFADEPETAMRLK
jgi:hypothetical protein